MNALTIRHAGFAYGEHRVFSDVEMCVGKGEICCLMGPNGCGKSTLLDCVLGCLQLQMGSVEVAGRDVRTYRASELAQQVAYVPQSHNCSFPYTVEQVVLMGRTAHHHGLSGPDKADYKIAKEAMAQVGVTALAQKPYSQISGGELQLVLLARALAQAAPLIVMDEPTAHLDFRNELIFLETVGSLVQQGTVSVLMATHSPNQAFYFENRGLPVTVAAMSDGRILLRGTPSDVLTEQAVCKIYRVHAGRVAYQSASGVHQQLVPIGTV